MGWPSWPPVESDSKALNNNFQHGTLVPASKFPDDQQGLVMKFASILSVLFSLLATSVAGAADDTFVRKVTKEDMPRIPATEPEDALKTFRLAGGFQIEMVASEPLVSDPVDACFDEFGRMFVAEMHGYPFSHEPTKLNPDGGGKKDAGIIRLLEDTDGDGKMDKSHVYADGISWPTSVCCYNGGVFVLAPGHLYYLKDTDGDHKADIKRAIVSGFGRGNVQALCNGLQWDLDNRICFAAGRNPRSLTGNGKSVPSANGTDLRFNPKTEEFEAVTGGVQFGHSMDDWGTRFVCSNSNHIQQVVYSHGYLSRNPFLAVSGLVQSIAVDGASAPVFRISPPEPWRIVRQKWRAADKGYRLVVNADGGWEFIPMDPSKKKGAVPTEYPAGFFTSATGVTIYRGDAYPQQYRGNAFIGDVGGNLVHRKTVNSDQVIYKAKRADEGQEVLASSDNWFRPVNFVNAPDGTLYILDMYRETIEHPWSIPEEIKAFLHLSSGDDRGRVYRLVSPDVKRTVPVALGNQSSAQLVKQLESENAWNRDTAQRLLWERQDKSVIPQVEQVFMNSSLAVARLHALCTLSGLDALTNAHLKRALNDSHPRIRARAVLLAEPMLRESDASLALLAPVSGDDSQHVRFQLASSLGESTAAETVELLAQIVKADNSTVVQTAVLSSCGSNAHELLLKLGQDTESRDVGHVRQMMTRLGVMVGSNPDPNPALQVLQAATSGAGNTALLTALGEGLIRRGTTVEAVLNGANVSDELRTAVAAAFRNAAKTAINTDAAAASRREAIQLLALADYETAIDSLSGLLTPQTAQDLQKAAVRSLGTQQSDQVAKTLLSGWRNFGPAVRRDIIDVLMAKPARTLSLLMEVEAGRVGRSDIDRANKQLMMKHRSEEIRERSKTLFGADASTKRSDVVTAYQDVLNMTGDATRGAAVFKRVCSSCHKVGDVGHAVAPDLNSVRNKSEADLLVAILDPNREAQPNFNTYTAITEEGRTFSGIIAAETASSITLRRAEAKEDVILRSTLEELVANGLSLMPEGLEKDISKQELADVIALIKGIKQ